jgi:hypothetical protein
MGCQNFNGDPILDGHGKEIPGRQLRRHAKKKIKKIVVCAEQIQWPGAGSNRRPSDFQDYGNVFVLNRHRP